MVVAAGWVGPSLGPQEKCTGIMLVDRERQSPGPHMVCLGISSRWAGLTADLLMVYMCTRSSRQDRLIPRPPDGTCEHWG